MASGFVLHEDRDDQEVLSRVFGERVDSCDSAIWYWQVSVFICHALLYLTWMCHQLGLECVAMTCFGLLAAFFFYFLFLPLVRSDMQQMPMQCFVWVL